MNNIEIQDFEYPEDDESFIESDDSDLNPFLFELAHHESEMERVEQLFKLKQHDQVIDILSDINRNLKKMRKFAQLIQREHHMFGILKKAYDDLKHKTRNHDQFVISLERGYEKQIKELNQELQAELNRNAESKLQLEKKLQTVTEQLQQKIQLLQFKDQEIIHIKTNETALTTQVMTLSSEMLKSQKELNTIKRIKTNNYLQLNERSDFPFSTFELVITSKIKGNIVQFIESKDMVNLMLSKKSLYFALGQFRVIIPQALRCNSNKLNQQMKLLTKQVDSFRRLISDCTEPQIKTQIIKTYELLLNPNEWIDPALVEATNFIKGTQFLGRLEHGEEGEPNQGMIFFLNAMAGRAQQSAQMMRQQQFNVTQFTQQLMMTASEKSTVQTERNQQLKKLRAHQQDVSEKLFTLGNAVCADPSLFGSYFATMQRILASLYVFSSQLSLECKMQQTLTFYMAIQHWELIEKLRIFEQMNQEKGTRLSGQNNEIKALLEQVKGLQGLIKSQTVTLQSHAKVLQNEEQEKTTLRNEVMETKQKLLNYGKNIKLLALEIRTLRAKNKNIQQLHNNTVVSIESLKSQVNQIEL